ncbi:MAG: peptide-methionine (S)-S-oxide reductase MsrA [Saprospiraceae bacterium]|jgi:peptide-methionine (S)-S-oxide reductase|nr:peptide-methionine (S)-S-oxide reductase MsrA [Saprospiraceae bacterium]
MYKLYIFCLFLFGYVTVDAQTKPISLIPPKGKAIAAFAEGCFWCSEHIFESVVGVEKVISGYAGGTTKNPTYEQVSAENTGHAESVLVYYDPSKVSFESLVNVFFASHDPTTKDQQGPDHGSSYRSIAFYFNADEKLTIEKTIRNLELSKAFKKKIVTEVLPIKVFYQAEDYHQDYIEHNPENPYVSSVSIPRFEQFKKKFKGKLKK